MLDLQLAASEARKRERARIHDALQNRNAPRSAMITQHQRTFHNQLLDALRKTRDDAQGPSEAPEALFVAVPERLLSKWFALAFGEVRAGRGPDTVPPVSWRKWDQFGKNTRFNKVPREVRRGVLVAHGLSPLPDTILLLADIGRAFRVAAAYEIGVHALLADISWMSYNRSIRRFDLSEEQIETGLRLCLDRRQRLYDRIGMKYDVHAIVPFAKKGAVHAEKINLIAAHYRDLISILWGEEILEGERPLEPSQLAMLGKPLSQSLSERSPLATLSRFPGAVRGLESSLGKHLNVVRAIAQRFKVLTTDTFTYYFAQYYAQRRYRGFYLKVAPISERDFDEPFDDLDESFRIWGDGGEEALEDGSRKKGRSPRLSAIYVPQYRIGAWQVLPYTPLSLDATRYANDKVEQVRDRLILLSDCTAESRPKIDRLLRETIEKEAEQAGRLVGDVLSFVSWFAKKNGLGMIDAAARGIGYRSFDELLGGLGVGIAQSFSVEAEPDSDWPALWTTWLGAVEGGAMSLDYVPTHIVVATFEASDWTDAAIGAAVDVIICANQVVDRVSA